MGQVTQCELQEKESTTDAGNSSFLIGSFFASAMALLQLRSKRGAMVTIKSEHASSLVATKSDDDPFEVLCCCCKCLEATKDCTPEQLNCCFGSLAVCFGICGVCVFVCPPPPPTPSHHGSVGEYHGSVGSSISMAATVPEDERYRQVLTVGGQVFGAMGVLFAVLFAVQIFVLLLLMVSKRAKSNVGIAFLRKHTIKMLQSLITKLDG